MKNKTLRILIAKVGLDGHDRGIKIVARSLRDAGFDVIYTGLHQTPEMIVNSAIDEDVDLIGISILSGAHNHLLPEIMRLLKENNSLNIKIFCGGIIPDEDIPSLKKHGILEVFGPGTSTEDIVKFVKKNFKL